MKFKLNLAALAVAGVLAIAGPGALTLALAVGDAVESVQRVSVAAEDYGSGRMLHFVQDAAPAATDGIDIADPTPNQEVVIDWGNWVVVLMEPLQEIVLVLAALVGTLILNVIRRELPAWMMLFFPAKRVNELVENAARAALAGVKNAAVDKRLTINVTNDVLRQMIVYMVAQAPDLIDKLGDSLPALLQKAIARLPEFASLPVDFTIDKAMKAVTPESIKKVAKEQGIADPLNRYLGGH